MSTEQELGFEMEEENEKPLKKAIPAAKVKVEEIAQKSGEVAENGQVYTFSKLEQKIIDDLDNQVDDTVSKICNAKSNGQEIQDIAKALDKMGDDEIKETSASSNRMLDRSIKNMRDDSGTGGEKVASALKDLRMKVTELDPSNKDKLFNRDKIFGIKIPFGLGRKVESYVVEYASAKSHLDAIITALANGRDELQMDNASLGVEKSDLKNLMVKLEQYAYIMKQIDAKVTDKLSAIETEDKVKASDIKQEILFPIRQKRMDLLQHMAVCMQGYLSYQILMKNNDELIKGVNRSIRTTVTALRTAIILSQALATQQAVLEQTKETKEMTERLINQTSDMLGKQGVDIQKQATEAAVSIEVFQNSFKKIFQAMDEVDSYRANALEPMKKSIETMEATIKEAKTYMTTKRKENIKDFEDEVMTEDKKSDSGGAVKIKF